MGFTIYSSFDQSAPILNGLTGSLLALLDSVLVNGYGTKPGAGWTKPLPNTSSYGMYRLGNGSTASLFVYDAGAGGAGGAEVQATGWDSITTINNGSVTGSNPFPTSVQLNITSSPGGTAGAVVIRKSTAQTAVPRVWEAFADSASLYLFTKPADSVFGGAYSGFYFGDIYSLRTGSIDSSRCMIVGRPAVSTSVVANERLDTTAGTLTTVLQAHFAAHTFNGTGTSITLGKHGDVNKSSNLNSLDGAVPFLNGCDNALYISPVWVVEAATGTIRGRMRGFWHFCHTSSSLVDGQIFSGSMDFPNKRFQIVIPTGNVATYFMEISDTLETNNP